MYAGKYASVKMTGYGVSGRITAQQGTTKTGKKKTEMITFPQKKISCLIFFAEIIYYSCISDDAGDFPLFRYD